jgi:CRP-like cAMP-binding protein
VFPDCARKEKYLIMKRNFQIFKDTFNAVYGLDDAILESIYQYFILTKVEKNQYFIHQGALSRSLAVVAEGLFKVSFLHETGNEYIKYFLSSSDILLGNLQSEEKSPVSIQGLKRSLIFQISIDQFNGLCEQYPSLEQMKENQILKYFQRKEKREMELLSNDAKTNYKLFIQDYASIYKELSQYHIAMYLGITPTQLSRIKKQASQHM